MGLRAIRLQNTHNITKERSTSSRSSKGVRLSLSLCVTQWPKNASSVVDGAQGCTGGSSPRYVHDLTLWWEIYQNFIITRTTTRVVK